MIEEPTALSDLERELKAARNALANLERQHSLYVQDKENYISSLRAELERFSWYYAFAARARRASRLAVLASRGVRSVGRVGPAETARRAKAMLAARRASPIPFYDPYSFIHQLKPIDVEVVDHPYADLELPLFSIIMTVRNEAESIARVIDALAAQDALADEVIVVDGGSTDGTVAVLRELAETSPFDLIIIEAGSVNIAAGRNIALGRCSHEFVVLSDAGSTPDRNYCRALVGALATNLDVDLVCGSYRAGRFAARFVPDFATADLQNFLPSGRSCAVRRDKARVIRFPEFLTRTGEDTLFGIEYRRTSTKWIVNRCASVTWIGPTNSIEADALERSYALGDGESGVGDFRFYREMIEATSNPSANRPALDGFLSGRKHRSEIEVGRRGVTEVFVILAGVPITDSGGGQRGTQLALELIRQGHKVVFVNIYPSFEEDHRIWFDVDLTLLELYSLDHFDVHDVIERYRTRASMRCILEFPHPRFVDVYRPIQAAGGTAIFDYIDNWSSSLGWEWYTPEVEALIASEADVLVASAVTLQDQLATRTGRVVEFVPNAVNTALFGPHQFDLPRPADMPAAGPVVTYVGALWGEWFDWETLLVMASHRLDATFVLIGNRPADIDVRVAAQSNVVFLGLKVQADLSAYLAHSDCCIIPFRLDHITEFVNPLKVYEYLAMGRPVLSSAMPELTGLEGVVTYTTVDEVEEKLDLALQATVRSDLAARVTDQHGWPRRVTDLRRAVG